MKCEPKHWHSLICTMKESWYPRKTLVGQSLEMSPIGRASRRILGVMNTYFMGVGFESNFRYKRLRAYSHLFAYDSFNDTWNRLSVTEWRADQWTVSWEGCGK
jgi:hypothetical protein